MSQVTVEQILNMIEELPQEDQELLDRRLAERAEADWRKEADEARREAKAQGIDQAAIDQAVRKHRYR